MTDDEGLYQAEFAATTRGDLLPALLLSAKGHEIISTTRPVDPFGEQSDSTTERIRAAAGSPVTRPLKCQQHSDPRIRLYCADVERSLIQGEARRQGIPTPSSVIFRMPAYGSEEAKKLGAACMAGTAIRRLGNGWEQLRNAKEEWLPS